MLLILAFEKKVSIPYRKQSYLICRGNHMAGYYMKCKAGLIWIKYDYEWSNMN